MSNQRMPDWYWQTLACIIAFYIVAFTASELWVVGMFGVMACTAVMLTMYVRESNRRHRCFIERLPR